MANALLTAGYVVTNALRRLTILDAEEQPTATQLSQGTQVLSDLVRLEFIDATCGYQTKYTNFTARAGQPIITIGGDSSYDIPFDAKRINTIYNGSGGNTKFELKRAPESQVYTVAVTSTLAVRFFPLEQIDGAINCKLWPTPAQDQPLFFSLGIRPAIMVNPTDPLEMPPDVAVPLADLLAVRLRPFYGIALADIQDVVTGAAALARKWEAASRTNDFVRLRRRRP